MPVRDVLWRCPRCGRGTLARARRGDRCDACGTLFRRGRGPDIEAVAPDGSVESRPAAAWLDALPERPESTSAGPEPAHLRRTLPSATDVRYDGELIGWVESFGERTPGTVSLDGEALTFRAADGTVTRVPLEALTSIQPSSRKLLLGLGGGEALALELADGSVLRWELLLQGAVQRRWRAIGRGEVVEYQPRIVAR